jgi:laminin alpha 3/5
MRNWQLKTVNLTTKPITIESVELLLDETEEGVLGADLTAIELEKKISYFFAPEKYAGNQLKSYGGFLNYSIHYTSNLFGSAVSGPDVILYGHDTYLFYFSLEQPASNTLFPSFVELVEQNFVLANGLPATREQMMQVLQNLNAIYIRATYWEPTVLTK